MMIIIIIKCIIHLGEHLQETYAIEVNRDVINKI